MGTHRHVDLSASRSDPAPLYFGLATFALVVVLSFAVYILTAGSSIAWWESAEYITVAADLGVAHPPGSLLLTVLGWLAIKVPIIYSIAFKLNLLAGLLAAVTAGAISYLTIKLVAEVELSRDLVPSYGTVALSSLGVAVAALIFSFSYTTWTQATKFTPYILTALFTAMIVGSALRWWYRTQSDDSPGWLFVLMLLLGLDLAVHRTNVVLLPGLLIWVLLRRPKTFLAVGNWLAGVCGLLLGLLFNLTLIPMARQNPFLNATDPSTLGRFWDYMSLKTYGGSWLVSIFPRKGDFWSSQMQGYLSDFGANFAPISGGLGLLGALPLLLGLFGLIMIWRRSWRLGTALTCLFLSAALISVVLLNVPESFFRAMDRHYLPSYVIFSAFIIYGAGTLMHLIERSAKRQHKPATAAIVVTFLVLAWMAGYQVLHNWKSADRSDAYFAEDFARNMLVSLPPGTLLVTGGDNDTYPLWYLQAVEKEREDVAVLNINLLNTAPYLKHLLERRRDFPLGIPYEQLDELRPIHWRDTTISIPAPPTSIPGLGGVVSQDSIRFEVVPSLANKYLLVQDQVLLSIVRTNQWRRPIYVASTVSKSAVSWLAPYLQMEGLAQRVAPEPRPLETQETLKENLLEKYRYRGYADPDVTLDPISGQMGMNYYPLFLQLAYSYEQQDDRVSLLALKHRMIELLPPERLHPPQQLERQFDLLLEWESAPQQPDTAQAVPEQQDSGRGQGAATD